jgi:starch synthase
VIIKDVLPAHRLRVLFVSSEAFPLAKTGGLGDVCSAMPAALAALGVDVRLLLPAYPQALDLAEHRRFVRQLPDGGVLLGARMPDGGLPVYLVHHPDLFRRGGGLYQDEDGRDWPDNHRRFEALARAGVALALEGDDTGWRPQTVHANDWQTGLLPALLALHDGPRPGTLFTIHNLAYQGNFPFEVARELGLPAAILTSEGAEFYGQLSFLKAGLRYGDRLSTVSPTYAREILTPEHGAGLDGLLRARAKDLVGILNGVDYTLWDPGSDRALPSPYSIEQMAGKQACKTALQAELGLEAAPERPLIIFVNRFTHQKMADTVIEALPMLRDLGVQVVVHGEGDRRLEAALLSHAEQSPGQVAVRVGYEEPLAHRVTAAGDIALTASRFEPCGLTTMYAMRYGTVPVTRPVGGLADIVVDAANDHDGATGFVFAGTDAPEMAACIARAATVHSKPTSWARLQRNAMIRDFAWKQSACRYLALYRELAWPPAPAELRANKRHAVRWPVANSDVPEDETATDQLIG